jgi:arylsulfatase
MVLAAMGGYAVVRLRLFERGKGRAAPAETAGTTAVGRSGAAAVAGHPDEELGEAVAQAGPPPSEQELRAAAKGANIVICLLDDARYDHFGCYGYPRETTPNVDRLARHSLVFTEHFCQIPYTRPSTASLLTSDYPDTHRIFGRSGQLSPSTFTMESGLRDAGWHTAFFTANIYASPAMGLGRDFDYARRAMGFGPGKPRQWGGPEPLLQWMSDWLDGGPRQPFFAYIHFTQPHGPYDAPQHMVELFAGTEPPGLRAAQSRPSRASGAGLARADDRADWRPVNLYDANLRYADWAVGELEQILREHGVFDNTILIITADHGEPFGEHATPRRWSVYDEAVHIPLVVKLVGEHRPVGSVEALTQTVDLLPTMLDLLGIAYPREQVQGRSLLPLLAGKRKELNEYVFARTDQALPPTRQASYLVRSRRWALILQQGGKQRELYNIKADPYQRRNLIAEQPEQAQKMIRAFRLFAAKQATPPLDFVDARFTPPSQPKAPAVKVTKEMRRELRALGYLD